MAGKKGVRAKGEASSYTRDAVRRDMVFAASAPAAAVVAGLEMGQARCVLTKGQFSLLDLLRAVLDITGPADVRLSTWSSGIRDAETAAWLLESGAMRSLSMLTDRSFPGRQPAYAGRLVALFGESAIAATDIHAKIALVRNEAWSIAIRSSMNLNRNPRFEQADIDADEGLTKYLWDWFDEVLALAPRGIKFEHEESARAFEQAMTGNASNGAAVQAMTGDKPPAPRVAPPSDATGVELDPVGMTRRGMLEHLTRLAAGGVHAAEPGSVAYVQSMRELRNAHAALLDLAEREQVKPADPSAMTPEEWRALVERDAAATSDADLEIYMVAWMERMGVVLVHEGDEARLVRRTG